MSKVEIYYPVPEEDRSQDHVPWISSRELWEVFMDYRRWCDLHPFVNRMMKARTGWTRIDKDSGEPTQAYVMHPVETVKTRVPTLEGFMEHCELTTDSWKMAKLRPELDFGIRRVEEALYNIMFQMGAAGMINANLAARKLELAENVDLRAKTEEEHAPLKLKGVSLAAMEEILKAQDEADEVDRENEGVLDGGQE